MTPEEVRNSIMTTYLTEFSGQFEIALDNQPFTPPEVDEGVKWVRVTVKFTDGAQISLGKSGNRKFQEHGSLFIQVFTPAGHATNENDDLTKDSKNLFDGERFGDLWFNNGRVITIGPDGEWYQQNAVLEFTFETIK